ncbi:MAG: VacJ family lipoprotein [Hyphomonadaceae bacterium]
MRATLAALSLAAACLCAPAAHAQEAVYDPFEGTNRNLFAAHEAIDKAVLGPVARGYRRVTNEPIRSGVSNFLFNLRSPVIFANDVLQGEASRAGTTLARFGVNSTIGVLGIFDPATRMGLERHDEDFGQTLAVWGVGEGPYIFVPVLGPTNLRDGAGRIIDVAFDPLTWSQFDGDETARGARGAATGISTRESLIETIDGTRENSVDPYVTFRSSYALLRESAVRNGQMDVQDLPEFDAIDESADEVAPEDTQIEPPSPAPELEPVQEPSVDSPDHASGPAEVAATNLGVTS